MVIGGTRSSARLFRLLQAHGGRWLDPGQQPSAGPGAVRAGTAYTAGRLLPPGAAVGAAELAATLDPMLSRSGHRAVARSTSVRIDADPGGRVQPGESGSPDPWELLAALQERPAAARPGGRQLPPAGLDHLLSTAEQPGGNPFAVGHGRPGLDGYGVVDGYRRGPVSLTAPLPAPRPGPAPRVVLLDTAVGIGAHPWFAEHVRNLQVDDDCALLPLDDPAAGPATRAGADLGVDLSLLGALGSHVGHGSFIAGILRQRCPAADIDAVAIMGADGVVAERTLIKALRGVADRLDAEPDWAQAVVLSLGYYAEDVPVASDIACSAEIKALLVRLARAGVAVFCAAGNDATTRPSYPAAFAAESPFTDDPDLVPLTSVGALNAAGAPADFSNAGPWVTAAAPGVGIVSALPRGLDGSLRAPTRTQSGPGGRPRSGPDPDDFGSGFGAWSGTSFAAPLLAAEYLDALQARDLGTDLVTRRSVLAAVTARRPTPVVG